MGSTKLLSSEQLNVELLDGVKDLWENSLFFDFTLKVEDEDIPVHRVILASCSGYFRVMFNSSMKESSERSVELKGLTVNAVKSVIIFIYTGEIELSADTLEDVLSAAHYLQIASAVSLCCDYLLEDLTWDSVSYVHHFARLYGLEYVEKEIEIFMLASFSEMPDEAVESVGKQILKLAASNNFCVNSEYLLFEKLLLFKSILSEDEFDKVLSRVRFPLMSKDELEKVSSTGLMTTRLSHLMDEAWEYHKDVMRQPLLQTERTQVRSDKVAMVMADNNSITGVYEDQPFKDIKTREPIGLGDSLRGFHIRDTVALDNFLYLCQKVKVSNGSDYLGLFRYDPRFNLWQELKPFLHRDRKWFSIVVYEKQIFAIGGHKTRTMEIYDIQTNEWRFGANINFKSLRSAGVTLGDKIYVCGGEIVQVIDDFDFDDCVDTLSCYDPENDTWQFKAPMVEARRSHQSVAFDGKLFVFAGTDGNNSLFSVEYYSPDVDQWTIFHNSLPYDIDGVCSNGSDIYILKRDERANDIDPDTMTVSFDKFNLETRDMEDDGFFIEVPKYEANLFRLSPPFKCSTLMLPFKFR